MLLRGLVKNFKVPIWYAFDNSGHDQLNKEELFKIIGRVEAAGFHVVSVSSDGGTKNQGVALELGITPEQSRFSHPHRDGWYIYWFYDPVHLLKRCRDHLIDKGYNIPGPDGKKKAFFGKAHLSKLVNKLHEGSEKDFPDIHMGYKLSMWHLEVKQQG